MGIFVGVNYGGANGVEILLVTTDWTSVGGVVGPPEGEGESGRHIVSTHGE